MKTIGLLGGMSWESTSDYYRIINQGIKSKLGGLHSAKICLYSVDFQEIETLQHKGDWDSCSKILIDASLKLQSAGADFLVICTNTMHKVAPQIELAISIPILHIADTTGEKLVQQQINTIGLIGTKFTMQQDFYKNRLADKYAVNTIIPSEQDMEIIHQIIYQELCLGNIKEYSRREFIRIIHKLCNDGAEGVILGCTEIALLIQQQHIDIRLFNTTIIHANKAVEMALI